MLVLIQENDTAYFVLIVLFPERDTYSQEVYTQDTSNTYLAVDIGGCNL